MFAQFGVAVWINEKIIPRYSLDQFSAVFLILTE